MESDDSGMLRTSSSPVKPDILFVEPFYGGSHAQLMDLLEANFEGRCELFSTPDKKWHWKARTSALYFARTIPASHCYQFLFASSVLNLAELIALRPDLGCLRKILYFHENQLVYPAQEQKDRDYQYGYNQIISALAADLNIFNSKFNMDSFLDQIPQFLLRIPSPRPAPTFLNLLRSKCRVMYFPLQLPDCNPRRRAVQADGCFLCRKTDLRLCRPALKNCASGQPPLHIVWPHRWEHDKNPDFFVRVLEELYLSGTPFMVSIVGQMYSEIPESLMRCGRTLRERIRHWGFLTSKEAYYRLLAQADVVVSTALHEFFGVSVLEAVHFGCFPLLPRRLVYPEIYPKKFLYDGSSTCHLVEILRRLCKNPAEVRRGRPHLQIGNFRWEHLKQSYSELFRPLDPGGLS